MSFKSLTFLSFIYLLNIFSKCVFLFKGAGAQHRQPSDFSQMSIDVWHDLDVKGPLQVLVLEHLSPCVALFWKLGSGWKKWVSWMIGLEAHTLAPFLFCLCFLINPGVSKRLHTPAPTAMSYSCHRVFLPMMAVASDHEPKQSFLLLSQVFGFKDQTDNKRTFTIQAFCSFTRSCWIWHPHGLPRPLHSKAISTLEGRGRGIPCWVLHNEIGSSSYLILGFSKNGFANERTRKRSIFQ